MRNKAKFNKDFKEVVKPEIAEVVDCVQDAAHAMNVAENTTYTVSGEFTKSGQPEVFNFKKDYRLKTDTDPEIGASIEDYFYVGRGENDGAD